MAKEKKARILIIDDEKDFLEMIKEKLDLEGYEAITACTGEDGLNKARESQPDLVICDVRMPKMDGFEVLKRLKKDGKFRSPFMMLTAVDDFDKVKEAYADEADFYVTKPVELSKLLHNIQILLNISKSKTG